MRYWAISYFAFLSACLKCDFDSVSRSVAPKLTLYVCIDARDRVYHAVYLRSLTPAELLQRICFALGLPSGQVTSLYLLGPSDIKVLPTDEVVSHLPNNTPYTIQLVPGDLVT